MSKIFISYSHRNEDLRAELDKHLSPLRRSGRVDSWHDRRIKAGDEWASEIDQNLDDADIILLLISPDFIASDYCYDIEMKRAIERHDKGEARVVPIILEPCDWHETPFGKLQALPTDGRPVVKFANINDGFLDVAKKLKDILPQIPLASETPTSSETIQDSQLAATVYEPRSSNLRVPRTFTEQETDIFLDESFSYIAAYFENSLSELQDRNSAISSTFKRVDANKFTAKVYNNGNLASECAIWLGGIGRMYGGNNIFFSYSAVTGMNSYNDSMSVQDDGFVLGLRSNGMLSSTRINDNQLLTQQGAAEYYWTALMERLQR